MCEVCVVIIRGIMMDGDIVYMSGERMFMLLFVEYILKIGFLLIGFCVVDLLIGCF